MRRWSLLILHKDDDVATALADLPAGDAAARFGERIETIALGGPVPLGHKVARRAIARGEAIRKYGAPIGEATADIAAGAHVHVHNLRSLRARKSGGG
jgi:altronate dehydratase